MEITYEDKNYGTGDCVEFENYNDYLEFEAKFDKSSSFDCQIKNHITGEQKYEYGMYSTVIDTKGVKELVEVVLTPFHLDKIGKEVIEHFRKVLIIEVIENNCEIKKPGILSIVVKNVVHSEMNHNKTYKLLYNRILHEKTETNIITEEDREQLGEEHNILLRTHIDELDTLHKEFIFEKYNELNPFDFNNLNEVAHQLDIPIYGELEDVIDVYYCQDKSQIDYEKYNSKYIDVLSIIKKYKEYYIQYNKEESIRFESYLDFCFKQFKKYHNDNFIVGIYIVGSTIISQLANKNRQSDALFVYSTLLLYNEKKYHKVSRIVIDFIMKSIIIQSGSFLNFGDFLYAIKKINIDELDKREKFILKNNLLAKSIANRIEHVDSILKYDQDLDNEFKRDGVILYNDMYKSNKMIYQYLVNGINDGLYEFYKTLLNYYNKECHHIFIINYLYASILEDRFSENKYTLLDEYSRKDTCSEYYQFHYNIIKAYLNSKCGCEYKIPKLEIPQLEEDTKYRIVIQNLITKINNEEEFKYDYLFIDFNIWDYNVELIMK